MIHGVIFWVTVFLRWSWRKYIFCNPNHYHCHFFSVFDLVEIPPLSCSYGLTECVWRFSTRISPEADCVVSCRLSKTGTDCTQIEYMYLVCHFLSKAVHQQQDFHTGDLWLTSVTVQAFLFLSTVILKYCAELLKDWPLYAIGHIVTWRVVQHWRILFTYAFIK